MKKIEKPTDLIEHNQNILVELFEELREISADDYAYCVPGCGNIGPHVRHILDFYTILIEAVFEAGIVNFDNRSDNYVIATNHQQGLLSVRSMFDQLDRLKERSMQDVFLQKTPDFEEGKTLQDLLHQVLVHTEHHCALIRFLIIFIKKEHVFVNKYFGYSRASRYKMT